MANGILDGIGVATGICLGKGDAHLHGAAGMHRVHVAKQRLAHGHHADHVFEDLAHLPLGAKLVDALGIALAGGGLDAKGRAHHEFRDQQLGGAGIYLLPGNLAKARHHWVGLIGGLLLGHRQHSADIVIAYRHSLRRERRHHIIGPALLVWHLTRQEPHYAALHVCRFAWLHGDRLFGLLGAHGDILLGRRRVAGTPGKQQDGKERQDGEPSGNKG